MPAPKVHDETLRLTLLAGAAELLSQQGPDALSLRQVAREAGTSTSAVYSLFGSKEALLDAIYREGVSRFAAALAAVPATDDPLTDLLGLGLAYRAYALANPHLYEIMFGRPHLEPTSVDEEATDTFAPLLAAVGRAQEAGHIGPTPAATIALSLWAGAHGLVSIELNAVAPEGISVADDYLTVLGALLEGWRTRPDRPEGVSGTTS